MDPRKINIVRNAASIADTAGAKAVSAEQALQMAVNALHYSHDLEEGSRKVRALLSGARAGDFKNEPFAWHVATDSDTEGSLAYSKREADEYANDGYEVIPLYTGADAASPAIDAASRDAIYRKAIAMFDEPGVIGGAAAIDAAGASEGDVLDTKRLDFMLEHDAFTVRCNRDGSILQYQLMTQDEDENYHVLHDEHRFFNSERDAIDAAIAKENGDE